MIILKCKFNVFIPLLKTLPWILNAVSIKFQFFSMINQVFSITWLLTHILHTSPGPLLLFCLYQCLLPHQVRYNCQNVSLSFSCAFWTFPPHYLLSILQTYSSIAYSKEAFSGVVFPQYPSQVRSSSAVPPQHSVFALITLYHNYSFMYLSSL